MSWSFSAIGKPDNVVAAMEEESARLVGQSKVEFDAAKQHIAAIVKQNFVSDDSGQTPPVVHVEASGSGYTRDGAQVNRSCTVSVKPMWVKLVAALVAVLLLGSDCFAGPVLDRLRERRAQRQGGCQSVTVYPASSAAPQSGCSGGSCPVPIQGLNVSAFPTAVPASCPNGRCPFPQRFVFPVK